MSTTEMSTLTLPATQGINRVNRALLERLHREMPDAFTVSEAARSLGIAQEQARSLLGYLSRRGWLSRVRRGLYVVVPLDARRPGEWLAEPWVVAERTFSPCYIGGWSACQHWGLTEQLFRTVLVVTARRVRERDQVIQGTPYHLTVRDETKLFGMTPLWRERVRVSVSDPMRTIVDVFDDPTLGGGMRSVADVFQEYLASEHRDDELLVSYADRLGNRAVFKRLGFVLEHLAGEPSDLVRACLDRRSAGLVALDPSVKARGTIVRRWGLRVNVELGTLGAT